MMEVAEFISSDEIIPFEIDIEDDLFCIDDDDENLDEWLERIHANVAC
jgi:hypothetical protein